MVPRLSDLVQVSTDNRFSIPKLNITGKTNLSIQSSFRPHQSNIMRNEGTPNRNLDRLRHPSGDNSPEQDSVVKKLKVN